MRKRRIPAHASSTTRVGLNERELEILQVSVPKQHYYVVSKLGRRLVDLGVGKVALSWVGVNGREERQIGGKRDGPIPGYLARGMAAAERVAGLGGVFRRARTACHPREEEYLCATA